MSFIRKKVTKAVVAVLAVIMGASVIGAPMTPIEAQAASSGLTWCNAATGRPNGPFTAYVPSTGVGGSRYCQMSEGAVSDAVGVMQATLQLCHGVNTGSRDSNWGPITTGAVTTFQRFKGIPADGVYGPQTHNAIGKWLNVPPSFLSTLVASMKCVSDSPI